MESLTIRLQYKVGQTIVVPFNEALTVGEIREQAANAFKAVKSDLKILFNGDLLRDDAQRFGKIQDAGPGCTLKIMGSYFGSPIKIDPKSKISKLFTYQPLFYEAESLKLANPKLDTDKLKKDLVAGIIEADQHGNPIGSVYDLGRDTAFGHIKLLVGKFHSDDLFTKESFENHVGDALNKKGFKWYCTEDEDDFLKRLHDYDVAWVISFNTSIMKNAYFPTEVIKFFQSKKSLLLWEDNDAVPNKHTTSVLEKFFDIHLAGNNPGQKIMIANAGSLGTLNFDQNHDIFRGVLKLYEGCTVCYPSKKDVSPLKTLAIASNGYPNIMASDRDSQHGRLIVDCGFTKLYKMNWDTAGTSRYVRNAVCWLAGASCDE
jgi:hypothetical protein